VQPDAAAPSVGKAQPDQTVNTARQKLQKAIDIAAAYNEAQKVVTPSYLIADA
jgi:hypothetical protein